ncbi:MAG TPA: hypothetical protein VHF25_13710 [Nitriliruptorales bacterium]|nr:hypothetical protein [Nitriliruptorales bacterium]
MTGQPSDPVAAWRHAAEGAAIPRSAREYLPELLAELERAVAEGRPDRDELAARWRAERGTDRRGRALRILDRVGLLEQALQAVQEARRGQTR